MEGGGDVRDIFGVPGGAHSRFLAKIRLRLQLSLPLLLLRPTANARAQHCAAFTLTKSAPQSLRVIAAIVGLASA